MALSSSTMKHERPSLFFSTWSSGVVRASRISKSLCCTREIQTFWPLTTQRPSFLTAVVLSLVVSLPVVGSVTPMDCTRSAPEAMRGRYRSFCACEPLNTMVFITYIWPWHAPELPPDRLISSMMTEASAIERPNSRSRPQPDIENHALIRPEAAFLPHASTTDPGYCLEQATSLWRFESQRTR